MSAHVEPSAAAQAEAGARGSGAAETGPADTGPADTGAADTGAGTQVAYLGPDGTFTAEAAAALVPDAELIAHETIPEVFAAVRAGRVDHGVVPIENMIEGSVNVTLDELTFGPPGLYIRQEVVRRVRLHLLGHESTRLDQVRVLRSQPVALAQCRQWVAAHLDHPHEEAETSTAEAARLVARADPAAGEAAVAPRLAAQRFGLAVLAEDVHDVAENTTRFAVLGTSMAARTGADKTSLVVFFGDDRPGLLLKVLEEFALRGINLTKIESRPAKTTLGEYCILIDCEGHPTEARIAEALRSVHRHVAEVRVLGAYPRADGAPPGVHPADSDGAYAEASAWHARLLDDVDP